MNERVMVVAMEPSNLPAHKPTIAYASVRIGSWTIHRVAVLRDRQGRNTAGLPRRYNEVTRTWQPIVELDDAAGQAVADAVRAAYAEAAA
jgi:hypothetical protein